MRRSFLTLVLLSAASPLGVSAAFAQATGGAPSPAAGAPTQIGEVIVTAERRAERLQEVPISVTAISPQTLVAAGVQTTRDLALVTPGLRVEATGIYIQPAIRGITTSLTTPSSDANVATYLDGVYQQTTLAAVYDLPDVQQIEVLKGPQGTLFGRNATGGAILINTRDPDLNEVTGRVGGSYGRFNDAQFHSFVSAPIVPGRLAVSLTAYADYEGAYQHDLLRGGQRRGDVKTYLARGKVRFDPWDGADFVFTASYEKRLDNSGLRYTNLNGDNAMNRPPLAPPVVIARGPYDYAMDVGSFSDSENAAVSLKGKIQLGPGTLTTNTAYTKTHADVATDGDNSPRVFSVVTFPGATTTKTQEFVYSTDKIGRFRGTLGAFFYDNVAGFDPLNVNNYAQAIYTKDTSRAWATFGEVNVDLLDQLALTGGLRYSEERRSSYAALARGTPVPPPLPELGAAKFTSTTPRISLLYRATPHTNFYVTYSEGFKSGAFNSTSFQRTPVQPEKVKAYEVGVKSQPTRDLSVNLAAFHYDYRNLQVNTISQQGAAFVQTLQNAATARIYGAELDINWRATDALRFTSGLSWLHARYLRFPAASVNIPNPDGLGGNLTVPMDASGKTMIRSPDFTANISANYDVQLSRGLLTFSGTAYFSTKVYYDPIDQLAQPGYAQLNGRVAYQPRPGLEFSLYAKNLTNTKVLSTVLSTALYNAAIYNPPTTFGVAADLSF